MSYRDMRGSFYSAVRENETQSGPPSSETKYVSFRLVFDREEQKDRGGSWRYAKNLSHIPSGSSSNPDARVRILGFRLAREDT